MRVLASAFRLGMQEPGYPPPADEAPDPYYRRAKTLGVGAYLSGAAPKEEAVDGAGTRSNRAARSLRTERRGNGATGAPSFFEQ